MSKNFEIKYFFNIVEIFYQTFFTLELDWYFRILKGCLECLLKFQNRNKCLKLKIMLFSYLLFQIFKRAFINHSKSTYYINLLQNLINSSPWKHTSNTANSITIGLLVRGLWTFGMTKFLGTFCIFSILHW